jgi:hypothetical protein
MNHDHRNEIRFLTRCLIVTAIAGVAGTLSALSSEIDLQRHRFLLIDSRIIEKVENAKLVVGTARKHKSNPLFGEDKPWEKRFDNLYGNVIYDEEEKIYKCWYSPFIVDYSAKGMSLEERDSKDYEDPDDREMGICYAISHDGITWEKPDLGLVEYENSKANNIIWRGPHGAGIFKDAHDPDPKRRYKTIFQGLQVSVSSDGLHWEEPTPCERINVAGDTHNNAFWAPTLKKYVGITRSWGKEKGRQVVRIESEDFVTWTKEKVVLEGIDKNLQTYAMPVFFYGGIYLGLVAIHNQQSDRVWTELTWSPDTKIWNRVSPGEPLIPCSDNKLEYDYGCVYPCAYPVFLKDKIQLYYGGSDYLHFGWRTGSLCLATLRPDGFAGYEPETSDQPAVITTTAIAYAGQALQITADVDKGGWVKVSIVDKEGNRIAEATTILKTVTDGKLGLKEKIKSNEVRLQFELSNAKLYSFGFSD